MSDSTMSHNVIIDEQEFDQAKNDTLIVEKITNKFPIPKNIFKMNSSKSSSYYRQNDERLESETESEIGSISLSSSKSSNKINLDLTRITPKSDVNDPAFIIRPSDRLVRLGETAKFSCQVVGTSPLEVFWFKLNGEELTNSEKYEIFHDDKFYYLKIFNTVQRDNDMYLCVISNELNQNIDSFKLQLRGFHILIFKYFLGYF
jgi:hypothetical protein